MITVCCLASGPSLTADDVELVRQWRLADAAHIVGVANTTFRIAPFADYIFAMDDSWWLKHKVEINEVFKGRRFCMNGSVSRKLAESATKHQGFMTFGNSGAGCMEIARLEYKATRIIMLGYDAQKTNGLAHWHGNHPKGIGNAGSSHKWPKHFRRLSAQMKTKGVEVVNASRETCLAHFPRMSLEEALSR